MTSIREFRAGVDRLEQTFPNSRPQLCSEVPHDRARDRLAVPRRPRAPPGYRTVLAPDFLVGPRLHGLLADAPDARGNGPRSVELDPAPPAR